MKHDKNKQSAHNIENSAAIFIVDYKHIRVGINPL